MGMQKDMKHQVNVLQRVRFIVAAGQQVTDGSYELFPSVWLWT